MRAVSLLVAVLVGAVGLIAAACSNGEPAEPSGPDPTPADATSLPTPLAGEPGGNSASGTVRWAIEDVEHLVPGDAASRDELLVVSALFEPLTRLDSAGRARAALASSWEHDDGARVWRFTLDDDARFVDDGERWPVSADDVAFAWDRVVREGQTGHLLADVDGYDAVADGEADELDGVRVVDDATLEVRLSRPHGAFDVVVSHPSLAPLPADRWGDDPQAMRERPVGNGPYRMAEAVVPGRYVRVQAVEGWGRGTPDVDEILFQEMSPTSAFVAFQQERLDVGRIPLDAVDRARDDYGDAASGGRTGGVVTDPTGDLLALGVNVTTPPFDQPEVRRALSSAIDRVTLADSGASPATQPATSLVPPGLPGGGAVCDHCRFDPTTAAATFAAYDVRDVPLWVDADGGHGLFVARLRRDLAAAGVDLHVEERPFADWVDAVRGGDAPVFRLAWRPEHRTGLDVLDPLLDPDGVWSHTGLRDEALERALDQARTTTSRSTRQRLLSEAEALALELAAVIPLGYREQRIVVSDRVGGLALDALGRTDLSRLRIDDEADRRGHRP